MALKSSRKNEFNFWSGPTSESKFATAERRLHDKKQEVEDKQHELRLLEQDAFDTYKEEVSYIHGFTFLIPPAVKWMHMLHDKKVDKRKRCNEKIAFNQVVEGVQELFDRSDIQVTEFIQEGRSHTGDQIIFTCDGHQFSLTIPLLGNLSIDDYKLEGPYIFKIRLHNCDNSSIHDLVGATFEECDLPEMLSTYLGKLNQVEIVM